MIFNSPTRCGLSLLNYVPPVPSCRTCLYIYVPSFFTCLTCTHFLHAFVFYVRAVIFLRVLCAFIFYVSYYVPSFFTSLYFVYVYADKTHTNELTYDCSLFSFTTTEFNHWSMFIKCFHFYKTRVIFCMTFFFEAKNINYF